MREWPAAQFRRAVMWLSGRNQADADRAENRKREQANPGNKR